MIVTENLTINGRAFVRTYSDSGFLVERDGVCYCDAIDPAEFNRTYREAEEGAEEVTTEDYEAALAEMGVML